MLLKTMTTTKIINLCSIKYDTSLASQNQEDLESDDDDGKDDKDEDVNDDCGKIIKQL